MSTLLSFLFPVIGYPGPEVKYDVVVWPLIVGGILVILAIGAGIVFLIIFAVKLLKRIGKKTK
jgi:hypothetical protein